MHLSVINKIGVLATILGCLRVVQNFSGIWAMSWVLNAFAMSPSPNPFHSVSSTLPSEKDGPGDSLVFGCESQNGDVKWVKWDWHMRARIAGPHRRAISFLTIYRPLSGMKNLSDLRHPDELNRYYFCHNGPLAVAAECAPDLKAIIFRAPTSPPLELRTTCSL